MRVVYGAGAVAAVSVMTIGLVQPSWGAPAADPTPPADAANALGGGLAAQKADNRASIGSRNQPAPDVQVRHVIKYIQLKPGQKAPRGATVITPGAPTPRVVTVPRRPTNAGSGQQANPPTQHRPPVAAAPPPTHPPVQAPPPKTTTHQSGKPR